jgi:hypothetical protein
MTAIIKSALLKPESPYKKFAVIKPSKEPLLRIRWSAKSAQKTEG